MWQDVPRWQGIVPESCLTLILKRQISPSCVWYSTVQYVDTDACRVCVRWHAGVVARIVFLRLRHDQFAGIAPVSNSHTTTHVIVDHPCLVVPKHVNRRLRAFPQETRELQGAAGLDKLVWPTQNFSSCLWNNTAHKAKTFHTNHCDTPVPNNQNNHFNSFFYGRSSSVSHPGSILMTFFVFSNKL
jgi:hypothetical protein